MVRHFISTLDRGTAPRSKGQLLQVMFAEQSAMII